MKMRVSRLYFCYGSIMTSVLWLSVIIFYFSIQEKQIPSLQQSQVIGDQTVATWRQAKISQSTKHNMSLPLPDLDRLAILHTAQDKLLRADGNSYTLLVLWLIFGQLPNKFHGHFATPLEYVIILICWSLGCIYLLNHIYQTLTTLYCLKIPLLLIRIKRSKYKNAEQVDHINRSGIFERGNVVSVR